MARALKPLARTGHALARNTIGIRTPVLLQLKPTYRCNMRCRFCSLWKEHTEELPTADFKKIIRDVYEMGASTVNFSGGEPLLRDGITELVSYSKSLGFQTIMNSNGYLAEKYAAKLKNYLDFMIISVDFPEAEKHDKFRGQKGAFDRAVAGIRALKKSGIRTRINCVVNAENISMLDRMAEFAANLGVGISFIPMDPLLFINYRTKDSGNNDADIRHLGIPLEKYVSAVKRVSRRYNNVITPGFFLDALSNGFKCRATDTVINVQPDGSFVLPCEVKPVRQPSALEIRKRYFSNETIEISRKNNSYDFCKNCTSQCSITPSLLMNPMNALKTFIKWNF